jgi:predicted ATP-binding protein involved in virulence
MKITAISVEKLFGNLDYSIPLSSEGITFIHGPNGCGKTTLLRLVYSLLSGDFQSLKSIEFHSLELHFSDEYRLRVERTIESQPVTRIWSFPLSATYASSNV